MKPETKSKIFWTFFISGVIAFTLFLAYAFYVLLAGGWNLID